jgi:hypothetical protein
MLDFQKTMGGTVPPILLSLSLSPKASCMIQHSVGPPLWFHDSLLQIIGKTFEGGHTATTNKKRARNRKAHGLMVWSSWVSLFLFVF